MKTDLQYKTYHAEIFNATSSAKAWQTMISSAAGAALKMRNAGMTDFKINIEQGEKTGTPYSLQQVAKNAFEDCIRVAVECSRKNKSVESLSDYERFAICVACKVPLDTDQGHSLILKTRTRNKCSIVAEPITENGVTMTKYTVYQLEPEKQVDLIS